MVETLSMRGIVDERIEVGLSLLGIVLVTATAYYTGQTGNWSPLIAVSMILTLFLLFVTSN